MPAVSVTYFSHSMCIWHSTRTFLYLCSRCWLTWCGCSVFLQTAEYLLDKGLLDLVVPRSFLKGALFEIIDFYKVGHTGSGQECSP